MPELTPAAPRSWLAPLCALGALVTAVGGEWVRHELPMALVFAAMLLVVIDLAWRTASYLLPTASPSLFVLAACLSFEAITAGLVTWTGAVGCFTLPVALSLLALLAAVVPRWLPHQRTLEHVLADLPFGRRYRVATACCFLLIVGASLLVLLNQVRYTTQDADSMWYHLVMPAEWVRTASTTPIEAVPMMAKGYPGFRQAVLAFLSLPMRTEHLAVLGALELPLLALATYAAARGFGAARNVAIGVAAVAAMTPVALGATSTQGNDVMLAILVLASVVFVPRFFAGGDWREGLLASLSLGALAATKFSGPGYAAMVLFVAALQRGLRPWLTKRSLLVLTLGPVVLALPWYARNWLAFGNPLYPARVVVAGHELFPGPLDKAFFAERTLGWNLAPLIEHASQFVEAHGVMAPLGGVGFVLVLAAALRRRRLRDSLLAIVLPVLLFVTFLQHPFNLPGFQASYAQRYLIAWFAVSMASLAAGLSAWLPARWPIELLFVATATLGLGTITRLAWPVAGVAFAAACAGALPSVAASARAMLQRIVRMRLPRCWLLVATAAVAFGISMGRERWQYDPDLGYHDGASERGWAACSSYVHRHIHGRRVGLHGSHFLFPLLGEPWSNPVFLAEEPLLPGVRKSLPELVAWVEQQQLDYLVCCPFQAERLGAREWRYEDSVGPRLCAEYAQRFRLLFAADGSQVLTVRR